MMKTSVVLSSLALVWASLMGSAAAEAVDPGTCTFHNIMATCGDIYLESIDDGVYGHRKLVDHEVNVVGKVRAYNNRLQMGHPSAEGKDNPDVAIAYAFMHYVCFDPTVVELEETKIYNCMLPLCPRAEGIEPTCEGMNS